MTKKTDTPPAPAPEPPMAADGRPTAGACNTLGEFVRMLENGQFDNDAYQAIQDLCGALGEAAMLNGGKASGSCTMLLNFTADDGLIEIRSAFKTKAPDVKRMKSIMWSTDDGRLTRMQPRQQEMFGIRDVSSSAAQYRDVG